jgi:S-methylmethionine-dependent homocysteine/selenocysteine methylase
VSRRAGRASAPFGIYPNLGAPEDELGFRRSEDVSPEHFAELAAGWAARGARVLGGCCGTTRRTSPRWLRALR